MDNETDNDPAVVECERCGRWVREDEVHFSGATDTWRCDDCTTWID